MEKHMSLTPGTKLGQYEIRELIGKGGMGEVYRAHDHKLKRDVALKLLPEQFARSPERLARFRREAELLASLNHPNIAAIYGVEDEGDKHCLVMELVLGETLAERLQSRDREGAGLWKPSATGTVPHGGLPLEEALPIALQIAEAVEAAHEKSVVHRDLKPANVKITPQGKVKVLDFGLAKALADDEAPEDEISSSAPTISPSRTEPGVILGTAAYMAPEQARGKKVDKRADAWAFGCVLYELLTGQGAFQRRHPSPDREGGVPQIPLDTVQDVLARVLQSEPDWSLLPETTPASVRSLLRRCLQKDVQRRLQHIGDARIDLEEIIAAAAALTLPAPAAAAAPPPRALRRWVLLSGLACLILVAVTGLVVWNLRPALPRQPVSRLVVPLPPNEQLAGIDRSILALSPDGSHLAYIARGGGVQQLYLRAMDGLETRPIPGTEGALNPFFSPDGQWIGFFAGGKLKKVSTSGGATLTLCDATDHRGASWGPNETIAFTPTVAGGLWQVSAAGGAPQKLTTLKEGEISHRWPQFLPGGKAVLFTVGTGGSYDDAQIAVQRLETGERHVLIRGGTYARYVPTGHLVYYRAGTMMAVPFDPVRLEVTGTPVPVLEGVMSSTGGSGAAQFSFASLGSLVYVPGGPQAGERMLVWVDRKGAETPLPAPSRAYDDPRLSPDGRQVALIEGATNDVWVYDIPHATLTRLTFEGAADVPLWTSDGKRIVYVSAKAGARGLFWKPADGSGPEERLMTSEFGPLSSSVSPDGQTLAFYEPRPTTGNDIWVVPLKGERKPKPFLQTPFSEGAPMFSPDGRWLAYSSDESGRSEIYVRPFPGPGGKYQVSTEGGIAPVWARNGRELYYYNGDKTMAVDITTQPTFRAGTPEMLFERPGYNSGARADYDIAPDGQRFLMLQATEQQQESLTQINVVLNWFEELKRRVPAPQ
jgi:serine/threonine-protein kinase